MRLKLNAIMEEDMVSLPFVMWDRFWEGEDGATTFGWIAREDSYKDFVYISYEYNSIKSRREKADVWDMFWGTSSERYTKEIGEILTKSSKHNDCRRVEYNFDITNCIVLTK